MRHPSTAKTSFIRFSMICCKKQVNRRGLLFDPPCSLLVNVLIADLDTCSLLVVGDCVALTRSLSYGSVTSSVVDINSIKFIPVAAWLFVCAT